MNFATTGRGSTYQERKSIQTKPTTSLDPNSGEFRIPDRISNPHALGGMGFKDHSCLDYLQY
jgi:hypothetical protein